MPKERTIVFACGLRRGHDDKRKDDTLFEFDLVCNLADTIFQGILVGIVAVDDDEINIRVYTTGLSTSHASVYDDLLNVVATFIAYSRYEPLRGSVVGAVATSLMSVNSPHCYMNARLDAEMAVLEGRCRAVGRSVSR